MLIRFPAFVLSTGLRNRKRPSLRFVSLSDRSVAPIKEKPPASGKIEGVSNVAVTSQ